MLSPVVALHPADAQTEKRKQKFVLFFGLLNAAGAGCLLTPETGSLTTETEDGEDVGATESDDL